MKNTSRQLTQSATRPGASCCAIFCPISPRRCSSRRHWRPAAAIVTEASVSFLGLGQQPPTPSWGSMLNTAKNFLQQAPWMAIWPGLAISGLVLSLNLFGDGLRDALDPRGDL